MAVVRMTPRGEVDEEYVTLVNPERDVGPTHIHGITAGDVRGAPLFAEIAGDVGIRLDGAVLVAHNARFDTTFLAAEFARSRDALPELPMMCTLRLAYLFQRSLATRRLRQCCEDLGLQVDGDHSALGDARAAAGLLAAYLGMAKRSGITDLEALQCQPIVFPPPGWCKRPPSGRFLRRSEAAARRREQATYLAHLVERLDGHGTSDPNVAAYLDVLDRALEDRRITESEAAELIRTAKEWGLSRAQVNETHRAYVISLVHAALTDGVVTPNERRDLEDVCRHLGFDTSSLDDLLAEPSGGLDTPSGNAGDSIGSLTGLSVCFTGTLIGRLGGEPITRATAQELAREAGLRVAEGVTRSLDILVVADPDTMSGKAKKARRLGVRIIAEPAFWRAIGAQVE